MLRRAFFATVGLGAGLALGVYVVRRMEQTRQRLRPEALAATAGARAGAVGDRVREALEAGRAAAAAREAELRARYGSPGGHDARPGEGAQGAPGRLQGPQWNPQTSPTE